MSTLRHFQRQNFDEFITYLNSVDSPRQFRMQNQTHDITQTSDGWKTFDSMIDYTSIRQVAGLWANFRNLCENLLGGGGPCPLGNGNSSEFFFPEITYLGNMTS